MDINTLGLLLLLAGIIIFFGGNTLIGKKYNRYEKTPENPRIGSLDPQIDTMQGKSLLTYILLRVLWMVLSFGLILTGLLFTATA